MPQLLMSDVLMGNMTGRLAMRAIKQSIDRRDVAGEEDPIVVLKL